MFVDFAVTSHVAFDFRNPKILTAFEIVLAIFPVEAVPKFRVAENGNFQPQKNHVGATENAAKIFAITKTRVPQCAPQFQFNLRIFVANALHVFVPLSGSQSVHKLNSFRKFSGFYRFNKIPAMPAKIFVNCRVKTCNEKIFVILSVMKKENSGVFEDLGNV